jgi:endogenous inhibitor of DNA gyrase (YacG/DUF329 family)
MSQTVSCPNCKAPVGWVESNPWRPFCSRRCKDADFIAWAEEKHVLSGDSENADFLDTPPD